MTQFITQGRMEGVHTHTQCEEGLEGGRVCIKEKESRSDLEMGLQELVEFFFIEV